MNPHSQYRNIENAQSYGETVFQFPSFSHQTIPNVKLSTRTTTKNRPVAVATTSCKHIYTLYIHLKRFTDTSIPNSHALSLYISLSHTEPHILFLTHNAWENQFVRRSEAEEKESVRVIAIRCLAVDEKWTTQTICQTWI